MATCNFFKMLMEHSRLAICTTAGAVAGFLVAKYIYDTGAADEGNHEHAGADSPVAFRSAGAYLLDWIVKYREDCRSLPVISQMPHNYLSKVLPETAPAKPEPWSAIFRDLDDVIVPGLTHWCASNKFFAYFKPHSAYPAVLGEMVCAGLNVMGFDWIASPACTELEVVTLDWLAQILCLPRSFLNCESGPGGSVIQGSAGESAIVVILAAILKVQNSKEGQHLERDEMVVLGSDQTHTIVKKACRVLGVQYHEIMTDAQEHWGMQQAQVVSGIEQCMGKGMHPIVVVATTGTTSSCAFDDVEGIGKVCKARHIWLHLDAAYGGAYACLPECAHLFKGIELADSFCVNAHKKLLCPFDLSALYLADRHPVIAALSVDSEYLRNEHSDSGAVVDYENWQLPLGRRFRALKLWFVLRRFGQEGIVNHVRSGITYRKAVEEMIKNDAGLFELAAPPSLSLVCFRLKGRAEQDQLELLDRVKKTGECFIIHTRLGGEVVLRFACGGVEQTLADVKQAWGVISNEAAKMNAREGSREV